MRKIRAALKPCANCDAGKLHGQISVDHQSVDWAYAQRKLDDHTPSAGVTNLSPDDEDTLRKAMATLFALDPMELLLVQHIMHGGSYSSFSKPLLMIYKRLRTKEAELSGKREGFRSLAQVWATKIADKMPAMQPVIRARIDG